MITVPASRRHLAFAKFTPAQQEACVAVVGVPFESLDQPAGVRTGVVEIGVQRSDKPRGRGGSIHIRGCRESSF